MPRDILVISDDPILQEKITTHFEENDLFNVVVSGSDEEALNLAAIRKFHAVILDAFERDSISVLDRSLSEIQPDAIILLFPSNNDLVNTRLSALTNGTILSRPFSAEALDAALETTRAVKGSSEIMGIEIQEGIDSENDVDSREFDYFLSENELRNLDQLLEEMPPPDPVQEPVSPTNAQDMEDEYPLENSEGIDLTDTPPPLPPIPEEISTTQEIEESANDISSEHEESPVGSMENTPGTLPLGVKSVRLQYYCLLIPNDPQQFLAHDISDRLGFILPQIHISRGWRMTSISVRPLYLLWGVALPADAFPVDAISEVRHRTTTHFHTNFPDLLVKNQEQDFWAPGYLILSGSQAPSAALIQDFIQRTRSKQQEKPG